MKKTLFSLLIGLLAFIAAIHIDHGIARGSDPPDIKVSVVLLAPDQSTTTDAFDFDDPIYARISLQVGAEPVYTSARFEEKDFHLDLRFTLTRSDGSKELITAIYTPDLNRYQSLASKGPTVHTQPAGNSSTASTWIPV